MAAQLFDPLRRAVEARPDVELTTVMRERCRREQIDNRSLRPLVDVDQANAHDIVFVDAPWSFVTEDWEAVKVPKAVLFEDMHGPTVAGYMAWWLECVGIRHVFVRYRDAAKRWHGPELRDRKLHWLPHAVDPAVFANGTPWAERDVPMLMTGRLNPYPYQFRERAHQLLKHMPGYQCVSRPDDKPGAWPTGRYYAALLGSARMAFQGTALGYVTAKTFEIPACGAALVTNWEAEMRDLGFCDAINCIVVNEKTLVPEVTRWLEDDDGLARIAAAGHALIQRKHTTTARAAQLVKRLRKLI